MIRLYRECGWWEKEEKDDDRRVEELVRGSFCFAGAFCRGKMIGMGRAVSDGVSDAYIQDVAVLKEFQGRGIAKRIVGEILKKLKSRRIGWVGLIAQPGREGFYRELGFRRMKGSVPMLREEENE